MGKTWEHFGRWFEANEQRFYCGHFDEKQIAFAAYCEGQRSITAKLRKLIEAVAWRDECLATVLWFEWPTASLTDQRRKASAEVVATENKARADYQAVLKAIIEEFAPAKEIRK